jgi:hypothetical protein
MKYWLGVIFSAYAAYLFNAARVHRLEVLAARAEAVRRGRPAERFIAPHSMAAFAEMVVPAVLGVLAVLTVKLCLAFYVLNVQGTLSYFDLGGMLLMIGAYATWLYGQAKLRKPELGAASEWIAAGSNDNSERADGAGTGQDAVPVRLTA